MGDEEANEDFPDQEQRAAFCHSQWERAENMVDHKAMIRFTAQAVGPVRNEMLMGREFTVIPAVLVQSQVLNNNLGRTLLTAQSFTDLWAQSWNMAPVVAGDHPEKQGQKVSARDPEILNSFGIGFVLDAETMHEDGKAKLKGEVWLDHGRRAEIEELDKILTNIENEEPVELSTGFMANVAEQQGVFDGEEYDLVMEPIGSDHLAVFTDGVGACSLEDGCGLGVQKEHGEGEVGADDDDEDDEEETTMSDSRFMRWMKSFFGIGENKSDNDKRRLLQEALYEAHGDNLGVEHIWIEDLYSEEQEVVFEIMGGSKAGLWRAEFEISDDYAVTLGDAWEVMRVTEYPPVSNAETNENPNTGSKNMSREELIATLSESGPLSEDALNKLSTCQLKALHQSEGDGGEEGSDPEPASTAGEGGGEGEPKGKPAAEEPAGNAEAGEGGEGSGQDLAETLAATNKLLQSVQTRLDEQQETIKRLEEVTAPAVQERDAERSALVESLSANEQVPFDEAELKGKSLDELRKLSAMSRGESPTSYAGRGVPRVSEPAGNVQFAEPKPYWETEAAQEA